MKIHRPKPLRRVPSSQSTQFKDLSADTKKSEPEEDKTEDEHEVHLIM